MTQELMTVNIENIQVEPGTVIFSEFDNLKGQALELAKQIRQVEVTEDNVQVSKKMLAAVNKRVREMEDKRISIKKEILEPYNEFERQVKEIVEIVKQADTLVRDQVKEMEERDREEKRESLHEIFDKRIHHYAIRDIFVFNDFLIPSYLNKSTSIQKVEEEMVQWLEQKDSDLKAINHLPDAYEIMTEYYDTKDLTTAVRIVNDRIERKKQMAQMVETKNVVKTKEFTIKLFEEKDFKLVEMYLQKENIKFAVM